MSTGQAIATLPVTKSTDSKATPPLPNRDGAQVRDLVHSLEDEVARREAAEDALHKCEREVREFLENKDMMQRRLADIVDNSNDAIIGKSLDGIITSWNKGAERMFGYSAEEAIGKPKTIVFPPDLLQEEINILQQIRNGMRIEHFETIRVRKDGTPIDVSVSISPIKNRDGDIVGASTIARDISEAKQAERALADLNERLRQSMRETHHRVKNNLQIISGMIELLELDHSGKKSVPLVEFSRLKSQVSTIAMVHDLLTKAIRETEEAQMVSVRAVLEKLMPMLQQTACKSTVRYEVEEAEIPAKQCVSLALITNELVSNALKHGNDSVEVRFSAARGRAILEVLDDGPGFPTAFVPLESANFGLELVDNLVRADLMGNYEFGNRECGGGFARVTFDLPPDGD